MNRIRGRHGIMCKGKRTVTYICRSVGSSAYMMGGVVPASTRKVRPVEGNNTI
jgi:hypothetical protein